MKSFISKYKFYVLGVLISGCGVATAFPDNVGNDQQSETSGGARGVGGGNAAGATVIDQVDFADTPVGIHGRLAVRGTLMVDQHGHPVQLKGPSSMWLNWESGAYAENKQGLMWMRDNWNATVIRAAVGVPAPSSSPSASVKNRLKTIIQNAIELGVYVIIDWHEEKANEHQAEAVAFFTEMAQIYGNYPNVIYETFNEPVKQDWTTVLKPYHEAVVKAIRDSDPDNLIVLGTGNWSQFVDQAATDPMQGENLLYTLHFYSCSHAASLRNRGDYALKRGLAIFVTEWGATNADGGVTGSLCLDEAQRWHDWMNQNGISWAAWKLDRCSDLSCYFKSGAPVTGGWTDVQLNGHAPFVRDRMREESDLAPDAG